MSAHPEDAGIAILTGEYRLFDPGSGIVELDLGCGAGAFAIALASRYPERQVLAADVMIGRLRKVVKKRDLAGVKNLSVLRVEARIFLSLMLPDHSINRIHLLCPDPWPKERHRDHRLLCCDFTTQLHRVLKADGVFHFSSDDENYCNAVDRVIAGSGLFENFDAGFSDLADVRSGFEERWLAAGRKVHHRAWRTLPLPKITIGH